MIAGQDKLSLGRLERTRSARANMCSGEKAGMDLRMGETPVREMYAVS